MIKPDDELPASAQEKKKAPPTKKENSEQWSNPIEFMMTCIGFAVGLGNVWRFPYLCFKNGGSAFVIAFVVVLLLVGLPLFYLEITLAQYSKKGPTDIFKSVPALRGLGFCAVIATIFISIYYNLLIAWSLIYAISSFLPTLPWTSCQFEWNDEKCCRSSEGRNCSGLESPARQYFYNYVLKKAETISEPTDMSWKLVLSLLACWMLVFLSLSKGIKSLGKVSYLTAIFPYIIIIALLIRGATLDGAIKGIEFYILKIDPDKLLTLQTWIDATTQCYFCLGISQGGLFTLGRHNSFHYNHQRTSIFVAILDGFTGILAGFAIFSVLGYMSELTSTPVSQLAVGGPGLAFIVYPEALSLMPFPWIWCIMFFLMMLTIGFGSILSLMECALDTVTQLFKKQLGSENKQTVFRLCACLTLFLIGLPMATRSGIYIQNLIDSYLSGYPVLIYAALEAIGIGWIYGIPRIKENLKAMLGSYPNIYWLACYLVATPVITVAIFIMAIVADSEVTLNGQTYPVWAHAIGWIIVVLVLIPLPIGFFWELRKSKYQFKKLLKPAEDWKEARDEEDEDELVEETEFNQHAIELRERTERPSSIQKEAINLGYVPEDEMEVVEI